MSQQVRRGSERTVEEVPGRTTRHSFAFGPSYQPDNIAFGPLVCHNDDRLQPSVGYPEHSHSDVEIVTWVLEGVLVHTDSLGNRSALEAGTVQVQSAGSGIVHQEVADAASGPTRFLQTWLRPDAWDLPPARHLLTGALAGPQTHGLVTVVGADALPVASLGTRLQVGQVAPGWQGHLPQRRGVHLFVATGSATVGSGPDRCLLRAGDALRVLDEPGLAITSPEGAELLVWSFN